MLKSAIMPSFRAVPTLVSSSPDPLRFESAVTAEKASPDTLSLCATPHFPNSWRSIRFALVVAILACGFPDALLAKLMAPESAPAGGPVEVGWSDPSATGRIRFLDESGEVWQGAPYGYLRDGKATLVAPPRPGAYRIGFQPDGEITDQVPITITPVSSTLSAPEQVEINESFEVVWTGPAYPQDRIRVVNGDGSPLQGGAYAYAANAKGGPVKLKAPIEPGAYLIIYQMQTETLASIPIQVGGTTASVVAPPTVQAGGDLEVFWTGPDNNQDYVALIPAGAESRPSSASYAYTGNSTAGGVLLIAPETVGGYEVAYFTGGKILARQAVEVLPVTATLEAPEEVVATLHFEVMWTGPGNRQDRIVLTAPDADATTAPRVAAYVVSPDNVVTMAAAVEPGDYELHYYTGKGVVLATRPIRVLPAPVEPGSLHVALGSGAFLGENSAVEVILDASGSMLQLQGDRRRIEIARETLLALIDDTLPAGTPFALRVFGHKEPDSCRTDLEIPLGPLDPTTAGAKISSIQAMNLARTPIAASLAEVPNDLGGVTGERVVILITDGEETCGGDPALAIRRLREAGTDLRVNIVGYSIDDATLRETFESWAVLGNGQYLNAPGADELASAVRLALEIPYQVLSGDRLVGAGVTGQTTLELPPGPYTVRFRRSGQEQIREVLVEPRQRTELKL